MASNGPFLTESKEDIKWAVVVTKLVERSLSFQRSAVQIQSSAKIYIEHLLSTNCIEKTKIKKRPGMVHFLKTFQQKLWFKLGEGGVSGSKKSFQACIIAITPDGSVPHKTMKLLNPVFV